MSYASVILADTPIRYWQLRETTGIVATDATATANGTYTPNAAGSWTGGTLNQTGPIGFGAPIFNGTTGYVYTGDLPLDGLTHFSVEFFIKISGAGKDDQVIFAKVDSASARFEITTGGTFGAHKLDLGVLACNGTNNTTFTSTVSGALNAGEWTHVVVVYDGTLSGQDRTKIYLNGTQIVTTTNSPDSPLPNLTTTDSAFGMRLPTNATYAFKDNLAEVSVYNVSLTPTQIQNHYIAAALSTVFTAVVPTTGEKVNLTFSQAVASVDSAEWYVVANGVPMQLEAATGATTAWSLPLSIESGWIPMGQTVEVSYVGTFGATSAIQVATVVATNNSIRTQAQQRYVGQGLGLFAHLSTTTFGVPSVATLPQIQSIDMPDYDMEQWFTDVIVPIGARYAVLTTKHDSGWSLWPTTAGNWNIAQTAFGVANPGADLVRDWVRLCRKYNLGVGLYINFYDPWWASSRPGADGGYTNPAYITYMTQQITELFSNYGEIDLLWIDSLGYYVTYANFPWANVVALRDSLQPTCLLVHNSHEGVGGSDSGLLHSDIATFEGSGSPAPPPPVAPNSTPSEFTFSARLDQLWTWYAAGEDSYVDAYETASLIYQLNQANTAVLLNLPPNDSGLMPTPTGGYAALVGSLIGKQGGAVYPVLSNVRHLIDRGDGEIGTWGGGINGSAILGAL